MRAGMDEGCSTEGMGIAFMREVRVHGSAVWLCQRRAFSLGLLVGVALFARPVSAADFGMEWLPLPVGKAYVWPRALEGGEAEFKPQPMAVESLPGAVLAELKEAAAGEVLPENVEVWRMNLDGQGEAEWFVSVPPLAGLGGPVYLLLQEKAKGVVRLGLLQGHLQMLEREVKTGWVQMACLTKNGEGRFVRSLWWYDAETGLYQQVRQEAHDFLTRQVEVDGNEK